MVNYVIILGGSILDTESVYGNLLNFSYIQNITCTGLESSIAQCTINYSAKDSCLPYCPGRNIGLKCFTPGVSY